MAIASIRLQNFRSYSDDSFEFEDGVNIIVGPNASGKTNLLEAVLTLSRGNSYRARDVELIQFKKPWARLDGYFAKQSRTLKLGREEESANKIFDINNKNYKRLSLENTVPVVFFEPNHLQFITRGPEQRRDFIDDMLERSTPGYKTLLASYKRALAQRNALLKRGPVAGKSQLFAWNIRLSELGSKIVEARAKLIDDINKNISKTYSEIAQHKSTVKLNYETPFPVELYASRLLARLEQNTTVDYERGFTAHGPHREDIAFHLNKKLILESASRGEVRSLLLALKIFDLYLIEKARGQKPIFLLDDVFSELDGARRHALVDYLKDYQTIITTTDADAVIEHFTASGKIIPLSKTA
jgi:DNA replication and repair protein RecF